MQVRIFTAVVFAVATGAVLAPSAAFASPSLSTGGGCYLVGRPVSIEGSGFAANRLFDVSVDGIDFGTSTTDGSGAFTTSLRPGGLGANEPQLVEHVAASDGTSTARATFTVTRTAGARFLATSGNPLTLKSKFQIWGFSGTGRRLPVFLHYVSPSNVLRKTVTLGHTSGQCGYLLTSPRRVLPFAPSVGSWTLQIDIHPRYSLRPSGPVARIGVRIG